MKKSSAGPGKCNILVSTAAGGRIRSMFYRPLSADKYCAVCMCFFLHTCTHNPEMLSRCTDASTRACCKWMMAADPPTCRTFRCAQYLMSPFGIKEPPPGIKNKCLEVRLDLYPHHFLLFLRQVEHKSTWICETWWMENFLLHSCLGNETHVASQGFHACLVSGFWSAGVPDVDAVWSLSSSMNPRRTCLWITNRRDPFKQANHDRN